MRGAASDEVQPRCRGPFSKLVPPSAVEDGETRPGDQGKTPPAPPRPSAAAPALGEAASPRVLAPRARVAAGVEFSVATAVIRGLPCQSFS